MDDIQMDHNKIGLENVVNESGHGSPLNAHLHSAGNFKVFKSSK